ncbi:MAG: type 1 glutamine amidotransferase [Burkholderiaceae bacterium]|nr:type 1 glutamine amidotransferase [Burkholderiaceae bacterium]
MRPIAVFQHAPDVLPGYFLEWAAARGLRCEVFHPYRGEPVPQDPRAFAGVCLMGGPMSVNDPLPWLEDELALIRAADAARVPVIGHCLGGQLLAKAFGAPVSRHRVKEIGWCEVTVTDAEAARRWLGDAAPGGLEVFQWHGDTFAVPAGARNFLASPLCAHQAFVLERDGFAHLGLQFHCEMTPALIRGWLAQPDWLEEIVAERRATGGPGVQDAEAMLHEVQARCARMNALAARLYDRWREGLRSEPAAR